MSYSRGSRAGTWKDNGSFFLGHGPTTQVRRARCLTICGGNTFPESVIVIVILQVLEERRPANGVEDFVSRA